MELSDVDPLGTEICGPDFCQVATLEGCTVGDWILQVLSLAFDISTLTTTDPKNPTKKAVDYTKLGQLYQVDRANDNAVHVVAVENIDQKGV